MKKWREVEIEMRGNCGREEQRAESREQRAERRGDEKR
jgi:hypothetical protein